jgi:hypothetical protein
MVVTLINPNSPRVQVVARHEAGHAAAAHLLGWEVVELELHTRGRGSCDFVAPSGLARSQRLKEHTIISFAAGAYAPDDVDGDLNDRVKANALIRELASREVLPAGVSAAQPPKTLLSRSATVDNVPLSG